MAPPPSAVKDPSLADAGDRKIELAERSMSGLMKVRERFAAEQPLKGLRMGVLLHVTKETAVLLKTLKAGGAEIAVGACNVMSTQDDVAAALARLGMLVWAKKGSSRDEFYQAIRNIIAWGPQYIMDDGLDLTATLYQEAPDKVADLIGGSEQTSSGIIRARAMAEDKALKHPIIGVNDNLTKHLLDNYYGTGQSSIDGLLRATNTFLPGKVFVMAGYGHCGKGIAMRARGMGCHVVVTEIDPFAALQALYDGMRVMPMDQAVKEGDIFLTATGNKSVITYEHITKMKDGAIIANAGQFANEVEYDRLKSEATSTRPVREFMEEFTLPSGNRVFTIGGCNLVNLAAAEGHPSEVMATSFMGQALAAEYVVKNHKTLPCKLNDLPLKIDKEIAQLQLDALGASIDVETDEQREWMHQWRKGF